MQPANDCVEDCGTTLKDHIVCYGDYDIFRRMEYVLLAVSGFQPGIYADDSGGA